MSNFELYIHGTPNGHQIWGSEKNHDYISTFYNHDSNFKDKAAMQIDICMGDAYYTYIHQQDVYDSNERPGSFFAMTICFPKSYCTNVYKLYQIFEAVYNQVCIGSLITKKQNKEIFLVSDFEASVSGNSTTVDRIRAIFNKNITELIGPYISQLVNVPDTFNKSKKQYSLVEVDSHLFFDFFKKQSIVVLPDLEPAYIANQALSKQINSVILNNKALESANTQLQSDNNLLSKENKNLSDQLNTSKSASEKKYSETINQLKSELNDVTHERDELKAKINEAKSSIDLIDKPVQKLTRLLAGRFPESDRKHMDKDDDPSWKHSTNNQKKVWDSWLNNILLFIIIALCVVILYFVALKSNSSNDIINNNPAEQPVVVLPIDNDPSVNSTLGNTATDDQQTVFYDNLSECYLDIDGDLEITQDKEVFLKPGKTYSLSVKKRIKKKSYPANVQEGIWIVKIDERQPPINNDSSFTAPVNASNKNIFIKYQINNTDFKTRTITVR